MIKSSATKLTGKDAVAGVRAAKQQATAQDILDRQNDRRDRRITKLKLGDVTTIEYLRLTENREDEHAIVRFSEEVHPDLEILLNQHRSRAIDAVGLDYEMWKECSVVGVSIKWDGGVILGYTLTVKAAFDDLSPCVTTPFLKVEARHCDSVEAERLCDEIRDCLDGKRLQGNLFDRKEGAIDE